MLVDDKNMVGSVILLNFLIPTPCLVKCLGYLYGQAFFDLRLRLSEDIRQIRPWDGLDHWMVATWRVGSDTCIYDDKMSFRTLVASLVGCQTA